MSDQGIEAQRVRVSASGGMSLSQIDKAAGRVVEKNKDRFVEHLARDIKQIKKLLPVYLESPSKETMKPLFKCVHNLRGQGTLFSYPLVTIIGGEFCRYIDGLPEGVEPRKDVISQFLDVLVVVQQENISGEGPPEMQELTKNMRVMVNKFISA